MLQHQFLTSKTYRMSSDSPMLLKSNQEVNRIQTHSITNMENAPMMEDIRTLKRTIKQVLTQVASRTLTAITTGCEEKILGREGPIRPSKEFEVLRFLMMDVVMGLVDFMVPG
ncbi:hypothetical protein CMV_022436 [Castanea mollissima]|uniref:Uncharacterized protein n=1 Tax=Castanea mollissima TaxID=60419 RepID=A0A8J4QSK6_9ROSI|nr:hypothetical protein CMV_022436 [Castanea mollissima]